MFLISASPIFSIARASFALGLSASFLALGANAWLLEFWSGQADCNYKIRNNGAKEAADTARGGLDHESNNCMMMSYDPTGDGIMAMKVTGWTSDCAIALWSQGSGSPPCRTEIPYDLYGINSAKPDYVFTLKSPEAVLATDADGKDFACITPLNQYVQSNSGFLGHVAYSCGGNGTLLVEEYKNDYNSKQMQSLIQSISASTAASTYHSTILTMTSSANSTISAHKSANTTVTHRYRGDPTPETTTTISPTFDYDRGERGG